MNRRFLVFIVLVNAFVSLTVAAAVVWVAEQRRPSPEDLAVQLTPPPTVVLTSADRPSRLATPTPTAVEAGQQTAAAQTPRTAIAPQTDTGETEIYVVESGDTLLAIAVRFGLTLDEVMEINDLTNPDFVFVGQHLVIPTSQNDVGAPADGEAGLAQQGLQLRIENAGELATESVQIMNDSNAAVNLQGWTLSRDDGSSYTFGSAPLFPGSGIRLYTGAGQDNSLNRYWGRSSSTWIVGSTAVLRNPGGELIAETTAVVSGQ